MPTFNEAGQFVTQQVFREPVEVTAPGVTFSECVFYSDGSWENALLSTGPGTQVLGCQLLANYWTGHRRGIMVNSPNVVIDNLKAYNLHHADDAWTIAGWDGTANLIVRNCFLEASGETIIFGGATTRSEDRIPQDILIERCTFAKPTDWQWMENTTVKNLFEIKCGKRITVRDVQMIGSWPDGQAGFSILCTVRNQDNDTPFACVEDVLFDRIMSRETTCGIQIDGHDKNPNAGLRRVTFRNSRFVLNRGDGKILQVGGGAEKVTVERCHLWALPQPSAWLTFHDQPLVDFVMRDCTAHEGYYGARGDDRAIGTDSITFYAPGAVFENVFLWGYPGVTYPYPPGITVDRTGKAAREVIYDTSAC